MGDLGPITEDDGWYLWRLAVPDTCGEQFANKPFPAGLVMDLYRIEFDRDDVTRYDPAVCSYTIIDEPEGSSPFAFIGGSIFARLQGIKYYIDGSLYEAPEIISRELAAIYHDEPFQIRLAFSESQIIGYSGQSSRQIEFFICDGSSLQCRIHLADKISLTSMEGEAND
jgi:hypothetical protein